MLSARIAAPCAINFTLWQGFAPRSGRLRDNEPRFQDQDKIRPCPSFQMLAPPSTRPTASPGIPLESRLSHEHDLRRHMQSLQPTLPSEAGAKVGRLSQETTDAVIE